MKKKHVLLFLLLLPLSALMAQTRTISGVVSDNKTGETLIGATVMDTRSGKGTVTNAYGQYSLTLPMDSVTLRISYVGYTTSVHTFFLSQNRAFNQKLEPVVELSEVVIEAERLVSHRSSQMSAVEVPVEHIKAVPVIFGETDILKAIQLLPGVQSGTEGMSGIYVRGGGPDENLFLLDGVPMYNVNHLGGFFSAFNSDAVKNVTLYKGSFPAHFGGRLSSVLDVTTNNGNSSEFHGSASIGVVAAKLNVEGPIVRDKTTFNVSFRRTYLDALVQPMLGMVSSSMSALEGGSMKANAGYYFYDFNAKVTHRFSDRSNLFATYYMGDDVAYFKVKLNEVAESYGSSTDNMKFRLSWGNVVGALRWNYMLTPKLFMDLSGAYTRYRNNTELGLEESFKALGEPREDISVDMSYRSGIRDVSTRADFTYQPDPTHNIRFGALMTHHIFTPEVSSVAARSTSESDMNIDTTLGQSTIYANETSAYVEDDWTINDVFKINGGVNLSLFTVQGKAYPSIQPRLSGRMLLTDEISLKAGYAYMTQYMHLLSTNSISLPTDLWVPVTARIRPMNAHQVALGVMYGWRNLVDFSLEGYYKSMDNLLEYRDGATFLGSSTGWEDKVAMGRGWAYGVEFLAQKTVGKVTGWVGYTWSKTMRLFDRDGQRLNNGEPFPAKYDRRHDISIVLMYKHNKRFDASATWVYSTGNAHTLALQEFPTISKDGDNIWTSSSSYVSSRNNFRMPDYHRLDVGMNFHKQKKHGIRTVNISVYNVYNRKNPFVAFKSNRKSDGVHDYALVKLSLFPIIPSVSYIYKF